MNLFELNKFAAGILIALLLATGIRLSAHALYQPADSGHGGGNVPVAAAPPPPKAAEPEVDFSVLLANADAKRGARVARKCASCHTFTKDGPNRIGPNLWDVVERPVAEHAGFNYSSALESKQGQTWTYDDLAAFLKKPRTYARGTSMSFAGLRKPKDRANLIAYLRSLSDNPKPLP